MHLKFSMILDVPRDRTWRAFDSAENLRRWQPSLVEYEPLSGTAGHVGATARLVYREAGHRIELLETITARREAEELNAAYDSSHGRNTLHNRFVEIDGEHTRWDLEAEFSFKGAARFMAPMLRGTIEKRIRADAARFKELLESGELQT
jgi:uncharacterized membrane protein